MRLAYVAYEATAHATSSAKVATTNFADEVACAVTSYATYANLIRYVHVRAYLMRVWRQQIHTRTRVHAEKGDFTSATLLRLYYYFTTILLGRLYFCDFTATLLLLYYYFTADLLGRLYFCDFTATLLHALLLLC